jgi:glycosyltransferase involved in cell wall biosynthesis
VKLSILFSSLTDYTVVFFRQLAMDQGWRIQLIHQPIEPDAPYRQFDLTFCEETIADTEDMRSGLHGRVRSFGPDCVLMCSWNFRHFMRISRRLRRRGVYVVAAMDNQWRGTAKQWLGIMTSPVFLKPAIDTFLVSGDRQAQFAERLGYPDVMYGYASADVKRFVPRAVNDTRRDSFLFIGRLVREKGVDLLLAAYDEYRRRVSKPWSLTIAGTGRLRNLLQDRIGVEYRGFVQPEDLPALMHEAGAFVLPSRFEPWGVVIHEAAAAGLPVICTTRCGASTSFVRDGVNGLIVPVGIGPLARALETLSTMGISRRSEMAEASMRLASQWTPSMLARYFAESVTSRMQQSRHE